MNSYAFISTYLFSPNFKRLILNKCESCVRGYKDVRMSLDFVGSLSSLRVCFSFGIHNYSAYLLDLDLIKLVNQHFHHFHLNILPHFNVIFNCYNPKLCTEYLILRHYLLIPPPILLHDLLHSPHPLLQRFSYELRAVKNQIGLQEPVRRW